MPGSVTTRSQAEKASKLHYNKVAQEIFETKSEVSQRPQQSMEQKKQELNLKKLTKKVIQENLANDAYAT